MQERRTVDKSEHYCPVHNVNFFKKGKMKGYAHPVEGTDEWCNEPELAPEATTATSEPPKPKTDSPLPKPAEILQGHCKTLGWGDDEWHDYLFKNFKGAKKLGDLSDKQVIIAINNLRAMAQVKEAGETSEIEPDDFEGA